MGSPARGVRQRVMTTRTRVTSDELVRDIAHRLDLSEAETRRVFGGLCESLRRFLADGAVVEFGDLFKVAVLGGPEIRQDESGGFSAYAPQKFAIAARPVGALKAELDKSCQSAIYYVARDGDTFKDLLSEHFGRRGWKLIHVRNGMEALSRLDRYPPVACVFEYSAEGWRELVRELKCDPKTNWVPTVGIFPEVVQEEPVDTLTVQADEIIYEPFDFSDFIRTAGMELAERVAGPDHTTIELNLNLPGSARDRREARLVIEEMLYRSRLPESFCSAAGGALHEALENALIHGHRNTDCCTITTRMILDRKRLVLAVRDTGNGFDHATALAAARGRASRARTTDPLRKAADLLTRRGTDAKEGGLARILELVDRVEFNKAGNEVVLTKRRPAPDE